MTRDDLSALETLLQYTFQNRAILETALTHRSFANEQAAPRPQDNERLEFLGDAVLGLVVGHLLIETHPELSEGQLSVARSQIVSEDGLSQLGRQLGIGSWIRLGRGEDQTGGRDKSSILADAVEAVIAAVYLDGGFDSVRALVERFLAGALDSLDNLAAADFKTRLQEAAQARLKATPEYRIVSAEGPDHDKTFEVCVLIGARIWAQAKGKSKKAAEQRAAALAEKRLLEGDWP